MIISLNTQCLQAYLVVCGSKVTAQSTSGEGTLLAALDHERRVLSLMQESDDLLVTGLEDGSFKVCAQ